MRMRKERLEIMKKIEYTEIDGLLYPNLTLPSQKDIHLTRFDRMQLKYMKEHQCVLYPNLLTTGKLNQFLEDIDKQANRQYNKLLIDFKKQRNITEELKEKDQMRWVHEINNIEHCINELIYNQYIYE